MNCRSLSIPRQGRLWGRMVGNSLDRGEAAWAVSKGLFLFFPEKRPELSVGGWTGFWEFDVCSGNTKRAESDPFGPTCIVGPFGVWTFYGPGIFWKHIWRWGRVAGSGGTWKSRASPPHPNDAAFCSDDRTCLLDSHPQGLGLLLVFIYFQFLRISLFCFFAPH